MQSLLQEFGFGLFGKSDNIEVYIKIARLWVDRRFYNEEIY